MTPFQSEIDIKGLRDFAENAKTASRTWAGFQPATILALLDRLEGAERALRPFASTAEHDIGESEADGDLFRPMTEYNRANRLSVGHLRAASTHIKKYGSTDHD